MPVCILFMIVSALLVTEKNSAEFYLNVTACLLIVVALLVTLLIEVPIDNQIRTWTAEQSRPIGQHSVRAGRLFTQREHSFHWEASAVWSSRCYLRARKSKLIQGMII